MEQKEFKIFNQQLDILKSRGLDVLTDELPKSYLEKEKENEIDKSILHFILF